MVRIALRGLAALLVAAFTSIPGASAAVNRVALVIGNSAYQHTDALANPRNDAADVAAALRKLGFKVTEGLDLDKVTMELTIRAFTESLPGAKVAVFYYAGHGLQVEGQNYLIPTDAKLGTRGSLGFETVRLDLIQRAMESETNTNIIFLDACRNNPLGRNLAKTLGTRGANVGQGLALVESGEGTLISFSTQPGNVALDGAGRNSPYATALVTHLGKPNTDLSTMLINVRHDVMSATERRQIPWEHSALTAPFYFGEAPQQQQGASQATGSTSSTAAPGAADVEITYWNSVKDSTSPALVQTYLDKFPNGNFRPLATARIEHLKQQDAAKSAQDAKAQADAKAREDAKAKAEAKAREEADAKAQAAAKAQEDARAKEAARLAALEEAKAKERMRIAALEEAKAQDKARIAAEQQQAQERQRAEKAEKAAQQEKERQQLATLQADRDRQLQQQQIQQQNERQQLTRNLQQELKRLGCDPGEANGTWNSRTQAALQKFVVRTRTTLVTTAEPTTAALKAVTAEKARVCGDCPAGQNLDSSGTCVAQARSVGGSANSGGGAARSPKSTWENDWQSTGR